ncbi:hypothetical protein H0H93_001838, partial [Arthromyces matolae]
SLLKQEYKDTILVKDAIGLVLRTMSKTMDSTTLSSEKRDFKCNPYFFSGVLIGFYAVEFAVLTVDPETKEPKAKIYRPAEIDALLLAEGLTKKDEDAEMKTA